MFSRPCHCPHLFIVPLIFGSSGLQVEISLFALLNQVNLIPQFCRDFFKKRMALKGIFISSIQPSFLILTLLSQTAFQVSSSIVEIFASSCTPAAETLKVKAFCLSLY